MSRQPRPATDGRPVTRTGSPGTHGALCRRSDHGSPGLRRSRRVHRRPALQHRLLRRDWDLCDEPGGAARAEQVLGGALARLLGGGVSGLPGGFDRGVQVTAAPLRGRA